MLYRIKHVQTLFDIAPETARQWALEFSPYLSPTATPGRNKHRLFTETDMRVFSLVAELKKQGLTYADIHAALKAGQRGDPPTLPAEEVQALVNTDHERQLQVENQYLQQALLAAQKELEKVATLREDLQKSKEETIRLSATLDVLKTQQEHLEARITELSRELGREYAKGFTEGLREAGILKKQEE